MLVPANVKVFYPLFSDVAIDAIDYLKGLRDENSVIKDVREEVLGKWTLECKYRTIRWQCKIRLVVCVIGQ